MSEHTLDPEDWTETRRAFHEAVDQCIDALQNVRHSPVWQPVPDALKSSAERLPQEGQTLSETLSLFQKTIQPYGAGSTHPRFWGWVHGSGAAAGVLGEMLAAFMNCNCGGRNHAGIDVERQVLDWCKEIFSFPQSSSGILTSGTSLGTLIALAAARTAKSADNPQNKPLVGYASAEAHSCVAKTFELMGLGQSALRRVPVNAQYQMDLECLFEMVQDDLIHGFAPFIVAASAGTVNTGAIDDLAAVADFCRDHALWMHTDAAFGGLAILAPELTPQLAPITRTDSLAFDFHKWLHVPYDAGCVLIKDAAAHKRSFSARREYLTGQPRGLAGGEFWPCDYGPELSRGFRALKIWFTLKTYGLQKLGRLVAQNCRQAQYLGELVRRNGSLELLAPIALNIVCFRYAASGCPGAELDALNLDIVAELQLRGIAAPSTTRVGGKTAIRVALTNHRTRTEDLEILVAAICRIGKELL